MVIYRVEIEAWTNGGSSGKYNGGDNCHQEYNARSKRKKGVEVRKSVSVPQSKTRQNETRETRETESNCLHIKPKAGTADKSKSGEKNLEQQKGIRKHQGGEP